MRFERRPAVAPQVQLRTLEAADSLVGVLAPKGWSDARVEAWADWSAALPRAEAPDLPKALTHDDPLLGGGPAQFALHAAALGWTAGLFDRQADAIAFREALFEAQAGGVLAFGPLGPAKALPVTDSAAPDFQRQIARHLGAARSAALQARLLEVTEDRLSAIAEAVTRCDGEAAACADPASNPALARAAWAAQQAGVDDAHIAEAIALAETGRARLERPEPPPMPQLVTHTDRAAPCDLAAHAGW